MKFSILFLSTLLLSTLSTVSAQEQRPMGPPPVEGPRGHRDWITGLDADKDGRLSSEEFQAAIDRTFAAFDKNNNGTIESIEVPRPPMGPPHGEGRPQGDRPNGPPPMAGREGWGGPDGQYDMSLLPPFFFMGMFREDTSVTKGELEKAARDVFASMDSNHDNFISSDESRPPRPDGGRPGPPPPPNAMFIAAELRFGDKLVKGQPFSADTIIEDTRRLYDGSTVTKRIQGVIYRDTQGRTRREQPLEMVGGFNVVSGNNEAPRLVFINDFAADVQYFLDITNKIARRSQLGQRHGPRADGEGPRDGEITESIGKKTIEGVGVEGTRVTFEIPAGQMGNEKPLQVLTENWFSPDLQMMIMSRHVDPLSGEHIFRLANIKRTEPAADLFTVPSGYRIEN